MKAFTLPFLLVLLWTFIFHPVQADDSGEDCGTAITAVEGSNTLQTLAQSRPYWYKFTFPDISGKKLVITSSTTNSVSLYNGTCDIYSPLSYGTGGVTGVGLSSNQEIYIRWYSEIEQEFSWNLSVLDLETGDGCIVAAQAVIGTNTVPLVDSGSSYWYKFTTPNASNKKLVITSAVSDQVIIYKKECDQLIQHAYGQGKVVVSDILPLTEFTIKWIPSNGATFNWNLSVKDFGPGDGYSTAVQATEGVNHMEQASGAKYWYKFTMPNEPNKKLTITSDVFGVINVFSADRESLDGGASNLIATYLAPGQPIYISWDTNGEANFDWNLSVSDIVSGDDCAHADIAVIGNNHTLSSQKSYYWYTFTMPAESGKRLVITSDTQTQISIYTDCDMNNVHNWKSDGQGSVTAADLAPNQKVYIKWYPTYGGYDLNWNLSVDDGGLGFDCVDATMAIEGENIIHDIGQYEVWYSFTMPDLAGKKLVVTSSTTNSVSIYYGSCDAALHDYGTGSVKGTNDFSGINPGQEVFIKWYTYSEKEFTWNLSVEDMETGDLCTLAEDAVEGQNEVPIDINSVHWFSFQMPETPGKKLVITSAANQIVSVYSGSCSELEFIDYKNDGNITVTGLRPNEMVYILWGNTMGNFLWNLSLEDELIGESCLNPLQAVSGNNSTPSAPYWFTYTVPENGNYSISSVGLASNDTYLSVYDNCNGNLLGQNDDFVALQSKVTLPDLHTDDVIYIKWENNYQNNSAEGFTWNISLEKSEQTLLFSTVADKTLGDSPFNLTATSSSGLPVLFSTSSDKVTLTGNQVSLLKAGSVKIKADQLGNSFYNAAPFVEKTFCINPAKPTLSASGNSSGIALSSSATEGNQWFKEGVLIEGATGTTLAVT
ncbi:MAG TPA: hypothetical protein VIT44_12260, partial [Cyclobacteriaceae bacterium]